ncbi:hypothetical protein RFI_15918, partial [Reticulomyxa filosa]
MVAAHWSNSHLRVLLQQLLQQLLHYLRSCLSKSEYIQCVSSLLRSLGMIMFERSSILPRSVLEEYVLTISPMISVHVEQECMQILASMPRNTTNEYVYQQLHVLLNINKPKHEYIIPILYFHYYIYSKNRMASHHQQQQFHTKSIHNVGIHSNVDLFPDEFFLPGTVNLHQRYKYSNYFDVHRLLLMKANICVDGRIGVDTGDNSHASMNNSDLDLPLYARDARRFVWNARKLAAMCISHVILKAWESEQQCIPLIIRNHPTIVESLCECLQQMYHEYYHYPKLIIENTHDLSRNITPIVIALKKIIVEMSSWHNGNADTNGVHWVKESCWTETVRILQKLMVIGTRSEQNGNGDIDENAINNNGSANINGSISTSTSSGNDNYNNDNSRNNNDNGNSNSNSNSNSNGDGYNNEKHVSGDVSVHLKMANEEVISYHDDPNNSNHNFKMTTPTSRHRHRNRVTFDWAGKEFHQITRHYGIGYTSENVLSSTTEREHVDQSTPENTFFMPFDVFSKLRHQIQQCLHALVRACPKIFDDLWRKLLPNDEKSAISRRPFGGPTVLTVTIYDPHPRVRHAAFAFLHSLMDKCPLPRLLACIHQTSTTGGAKGTLDIGASRSAIATANASRTAFTPMSDRALSILQAIHYGLMLLEPKGFEFR